MSDHHEPTAGDASPDAAPAGVEPRRAVAGGLTVFGAILGFTATRAVVDAGRLPEELILAALPAFGVVGLVGLVVFLSAVVHD